MNKPLPELKIVAEWMRKKLIDEETNWQYGSERYRMLELFNYLLLLTKDDECGKAVDYENKTNTNAS